MLAVLAACGGPDPPGYVARDPCAGLAITAMDATSVELDGIADAQALWRARGVAAFDGEASGTTLVVRFAEAGSVFHGVYDPVSDSVVINRGITDRATLAIVIAHELGHVFGLAHVAASTRVSLMNPGNLATPPTEADQQTLEALWGTCE
jgi:hypothetical protein